MAYEEQMAENEKISKSGSKKVLVVGIIAAIFVLLFLGFTGYYLMNEKAADTEKTSLTISIIDKVNYLETKINSIDGQPKVVETTKIIDNTINLEAEKDKMKAEIISDLIKSKTVEDCISVKQPGDKEWIYTCHSAK